jgi:energy-coupling factor transport system permease protein
MLKNISIGVYLPGNSFIHRLQGRTKLLALCCLLLWMVLANQHHWHFIPYISILSIIILAIIGTRISPWEFVRRMWILLLLLAIGFPMSLFLPTREEQVIGTIGPFITNYGALRNVFLVSALISALGFLSSLLPIPVLRHFWQRKWLKRFRFPLLFLALFSLLSLSLTWSPPSVRPFTFGPYHMGADTTWALLAGTFSLVVLLTCSLLLTMTTSPVALIEGLTLLLSPLRRLKFPVDDFALMSLLALRFIPTMMDEVEHLIKAQTVRGADMTQGSMRERLQSLSMLFVPLMQGTLRQASDLAIALEARGYEVDGRQTMLHETAYHVGDYVVLLAFPLLIAGTLWF